MLGCRLVTSDFVMCNLRYFPALDKTCQYFYNLHTVRWLHQAMGTDGSTLLRDSLTLPINESFCCLAWTRSLDSSEGLILIICRILRPRDARVAGRR